MLIAVFRMVGNQTRKRINKRMKTGLHKGPNNCDRFWQPLVLGLYENVKEVPDNVTDYLDSICGSSCLRVWFM